MVTRIIANTVARKVRDNVKDAVSGTLGLSGERMSKVDTAWLRMDSPSNLMMIVGVWVLRPGIRYQDLLEYNQLRPGVRPAAGEKIYLQGPAPSRPLVNNVN